MSMARRKKGTFRVTNAEYDEIARYSAAQDVAMGAMVRDTMLALARGEVELQPVADVDDAAPVLSVVPDPVDADQQPQESVELTPIVPAAHVQAEPWSAVRDQHSAFDQWLGDTIADVLGRVDVISIDRFRDALAAEGVLVLDATQEWVYRADDLTSQYDPNSRSQVTQRRGAAQLCDAFTAEAVASLIGQRARQMGYDRDVQVGS